MPDLILNRVDIACYRTQFELDTLIETNNHQAE